MRIKIGNQEYPIKGYRFTKIVTPMYKVGLVEPDIYITELACDLEVFINAQDLFNLVGEFELEGFKFNVHSVILSDNIAEVSARTWGPAIS